MEITCTLAEAHFPQHYPDKFMVGGCGILRASGQRPGQAIVTSSWDCISLSI